MASIRLFDLPDKLRYPSNCQAELNQLHTSVIQYAEANYREKLSFKRDVIRTMNVLSYMKLNGFTIPKDWKPSDLVDKLPSISEDNLKGCLKDVYIQLKEIDWSDLEESADNSANVSEPVNIESDDEFMSKFLEDEPLLNPSKAEDLYLQGPIVPIIDVNSVFATTEVAGTKLVIYKSLPEIPTRQCEISVTTDPSLLNEQDLLKLYPAQTVYTRRPEMYLKIDGIEFDPILGSILPIKGFTKKQLVDNIVKYPHLENIQRLGKSPTGCRYVEFWKFIEIDGQLLKTKDVWDSLPESKIIPRSKFFMEEYVIRRYLLERDIKKIDHKYKIFGDLDPYLTLFTTPDTYIKYGHTDTVGIARCCVESRISYKRSRNPILRRMSENG